MTKVLLTVLWVAALGGCSSHAALHAAERGDAAALSDAGPDSAVIVEHADAGARERGAIGRASAAGPRTDASVPAASDGSIGGPADAASQGGAGDAGTAGAGGTASDRGAAAGAGAPANGGSASAGSGGRGAAGGTGVAGTGTATAGVGATFGAGGSIAVTGVPDEPVPCAVDDDCRKSTIPSSLWKPICDPIAHTCGPCPAVDQQARVEVGVVACLSLLQLEPCEPHVSRDECLILSCHRSCDSGSAAPANHAAAAGGGPGVAPNTAWLGGGKPVPCTSNADCRKALYTPVCNSHSGLCDVCPDPDDEKALALRIDACIISASPRCLEDEDCRFSGCITTCEER